jgi:hypothetical protein
MINYKRFHELEEVMDASDLAEPPISHVAIHDSKTRSFLEKHDIIETNIRGSSYPSKNFKLFKDVLTDILYELIEDSEVPLGCEGLGGENLILCRNCPNKNSNDGCETFRERYGHRFFY